MLHVVIGQVEPRVGTVEDDDVEVRVQFDQADELGQLRDGRRRDRVDRRVVEGHAAVAEAAMVDADMRPGPRPGFRNRGRCWKGWRRSCSLRLLTVGRVRDPPGLLCRCQEDTYASTAASRQWDSLVGPWLVSARALPGADRKRPCACSARSMPITADPGTDQWPSRA